MTAEIAVMNKSAVALAADSAVTISNAESSKIYNGAEKLFALSKRRPVGIMIYGAGTLCGVPWELIVKEYRKSLGDRGFDTLEGYAEDFWSFLCSNDGLIPPEMREANLTYNYGDILDFIFKIVDMNVTDFIEREEAKPDEGQTEQIFYETCVNFLNSLAGTDTYEGFNEKVLAEVKEFAQKELDKLLAERLNSQIADRVVQKMCDILVEATAKQGPFGRNSGIVFAGYGEKEYFPVVLAFNVQGFFGDILRFSPNLNKSAAAGQSRLIAYAQEEVVTTFVSGINPKLHKQINDCHQDSVEDLLVKVNSILEEKIQDEGELATLKEEIVSLANSKWEEAHKTINEIIGCEHISNVLEMIEFLPKDELGYMAESLVNITAFKRKVSVDTESVGGPIDVAIISKGDGFIWAKRKHYFSKELNEHYFKNL